MRAPPVRACGGAVTLRSDRDGRVSKIPPASTGAPNGLRIGGTPFESCRACSTMPSLIRLLVILGILGGLGYGTLWAFATLVKPQMREMSIVVPPDRFAK